MLRQASSAGSATEPGDFYNRRFDSIQALRGVCAVFVILAHIRFVTSGGSAVNRFFYISGGLAVNIFLCISGFVIMFSTHRDSSHFLMKRLIRLLPLYYLMTLGTYAVMLLFPKLFEQSRPDPVFLIKSLLFLPFDIGGGAVQPLLRVGWTINCEIFFYLVFWLSMKISRRFRGLICSLILLGVIALAQVVPNPSVELSFWGSVEMVDFVLGILCYYGAKGIYRLYAAGRLPGFCSALGFLLSLLGFFCLFSLEYRYNLAGWMRDLLFGSLAALVVLSVFTAGLTLKAPRLFTRLGDISYSIYLIHYCPVMFFDRYVFDFSVCNPRSLLGALVVILLSVLLAWAAWEILERRFSSWLRRRLLGDSKEGYGKPPIG